MRTRLPVTVLAGVLLLGGAGALAQAEAERRLDAAIERLRTALGPDARLEIGARRFDPVTGRATLTDVVLIRRDERTTIPEVVLSDLGDTRIGRAELLRITERSNDGSVTAETARLVLAGLALPAPGAAFTWEGLAFEAADLEGFRLAAPDIKLGLQRLALRDWRDLGIGAGTLEGLDYRGAGSDANTLRLGRIAIESVALPLAGQDFAPTVFRAGRIALEGLELREAAQDVAFSLGRLELRDWLPGRPTALVLERLQGAGASPQLGAVEARLARLEVSGLDAAGTVEAILASRQVPDPFPGVAQRLTLEGLESMAEGQPLLSLARLSSEGRLQNGVAAGALILEGFRLVLPRSQAGWLEGLGYREIAGGIEMRGSVPRDGGRLALDPLRIVWEEAMTLGLALQIDGLPPLPAAGAEVDPAVTAAQLAAAQLGGATLTLRDHGLMGRAIAQQAREQRIPPARVREQWAQMVLAMPLPGTPPQGPQARRGTPAQPGAGPDPLMPLRQALVAFIRQPGTLEIALRPTKPLPFESLQALAGVEPARAVQILGLTATAR